MNRQLQFGFLCLVKQIYIVYVSSITRRDAKHEKAAERKIHYAHSMSNEWVLFLFGRHALHAPSRVCLSVWNGQKGVIGRGREVEIGKYKTDSVFIYINYIWDVFDLSFPLSVETTYATTRACLLCAQT